MSVKRASLQFLVLGLAMLTMTCRDQADPMSPVDPQFAKGGKPGAPAEEAFELLEFYVWKQVDGPDMVHVVGKGPQVDQLNLNAVLDYAFNGMADGNYTPHYEYYTFPPAPVDVEQDAEGVFHVDVPWDGERSRDSQTGTFEYFKDFPTHDVDGAGADPFSFWMWYLREGESGALEQFSPQGIILGGEETFEAQRSHPDGSAFAETHPTWDSGDVYSYATSQGTGASGKIFLTDVSLEEATASCSIVKTTERIGKDRVTSWFAEVSGEVGFTTASEGVTDPAPGFWIELHLADMADPENPVFSDRATLDRDGTDLSFTGTLTRRLPIDGPDAMEGVSLSFVVDYLFPTWYPADFTNGDGGFVYDPTMNSNDGFATTGLVVRTIGDHGPMAFSTPIWVTCK